MKHEQWLKDQVRDTHKLVEMGEVGFVSNKEANRRVLEHLEQMKK